MKNQDQELLDEIKVKVINTIKAISKGDEESKKPLKIVLGMLQVLCVIPLGTLEGGGGILTFPIFYLAFIIVSLMPIQFVWKLSSKWNILLRYSARGITSLFSVFYLMFFGVIPLPL